MLPVTCFEFAPPAFERYAGRVYALTHAEVAVPGSTRNHVVLRIDPAGDPPRVAEDGTSETLASGFINPLSACTSSRMRCE